MNHEFLLPVCEKHQIHLSFVKGFYKMPGHWRNPPLLVRCAQRNCSHDADHWLVIELTEDVFGGGPSPRKPRHIQESLRYALPNVNGGNEP